VRRETRVSRGRFRVGHSALRINTGTARFRTSIVEMISRAQSGSSVLRMKCLSTSRALLLFRDAPAKDLLGPPASLLRAHPSARFSPRLFADRHAGSRRLRRRHRAVRASAPRRRRLRIRSPSRRRDFVTVAPPRPVRERARLVPSRGVRARRDTHEARGCRPRRVPRRVRGVRRRRVGGFGSAGGGIFGRERDDDVRDDARGGVVPERPAFGG
jgi:hypothetical protein